MATYGGTRDHLDDLVELAVRITRRAAMRGADARARGDAEVAVAMLTERIDDRIAATESGGRTVPLARAATTFSLTTSELAVVRYLVATSVAPERLRAAGSPDRITLEYLDDAIYAAGDRDAFSAELGTRGRLFRHGLVEWAEPSEQASGRLGRAVRAHARVVDLAFGHLELADDVAAVAELTLAPPDGAGLLVSAVARATAIAVVQAQTQRRDEPALALQGLPGSGRTTLALAAAAAAGRAALTVRCGDLPGDGTLVDVLASVAREATLFDAVVILRDAEQLLASPDEGRRDRARALDAVLGGAPLSLILTCPPQLPQALMRERGVVAVELPLPDRGTRTALWQRALPTAAPELAEHLAARYAVTGGTIARAARGAVVHAQAAGRAVNADDGQRGVRAAVEDRLTRLGTRVDWRPTWDELVLPDEQLAELREMAGRVTYRRQVLDDWGFAARMGKGLGLPVLFSGPPGTGKTMAAAVLAGTLGLDLYQIDLARMVSKYVGETEKHLAAVFDAAEAGHAILLFDEADALFAKRTEVKTANDRYANLEVNYLLQRMEAFTGVTILTTNLDSGIDPAFRRRLAFHVAFPLPEAEERSRLWRTVIPPRAACADDVDFVELGRRFAMTGGYIRNAALRAAYLAASRQRPIGMAHLIEAAITETAAMGRVIHGGA